MNSGGEEECHKRIWYNMHRMATDLKQAARKFREFWTLAKDSEVGGYQEIAG